MEKWKTFSVFFFFPACPNCVNFVTVYEFGVMFCETQCRYGMVRLGELVFLPSVFAIFVFFCGLLKILFHLRTDG